MVVGSGPSRINICEDMKEAMPLLLHSIPVGRWWGRGHRGRGSTCIAQEGRSWVTIGAGEESRPLWLSLLRRCNCCHPFTSLLLPCSRCHGLVTCGCHQPSCPCCQCHGVVSAWLLSLSWCSIRVSRHVITIRLVIMPVWPCVGWGLRGQRVEDEKHEWREFGHVLAMCWQCKTKKYKCTWGNQVQCLSLSKYEHWQITQYTIQDSTLLPNCATYLALWLWRPLVIEKLCCILLPLTTPSLFCLCPQPSTPLSSSQVPTSGPRIKLHHLTQWYHMHQAHCMPPQQPWTTWWTTT